MTPVTTKMAGGSFSIAVRETERSGIWIARRTMSARRMVMPTQTSDPVVWESA